MKKFLSFLILFTVQAGMILYACDVCEDSQPKLLKGITHGAGPQGFFDYAMLYGSGIVVLVVLIWSVKLMIKPKESNPDHIKYIVVE